MRKKYTRWYIKHMETVERSLLLRVIHYWLFSPSVYHYEMAKCFSIHSPSKLLCEQTARAMTEAQVEVEEWIKNKSEEIKKFQIAVGISPHTF